MDETQTPPSDVLLKPDEIESQGVQLTERDIVFDCPHCHGELVVDLDGTGLSLPCTLCGENVTVPEYHGPSLQFLQAATSRLAEALQQTRNSDPKSFDFHDWTRERAESRRNELQQMLRETQTESSEMRANVNHARIQLHRHQLKLEMLHARQLELKSELDSLTAALEKFEETTLEQAGGGAPADERSRQRPLKT